MSRLFGIEDALDSDAWYTPAWVFEGMGIEFDLDVASPAEPPPWIPAKRAFTVADDGLTMPWVGVVWCNPPYSNPAPWCRKWAEHEPGGCILLRADLSTSGIHAALSTSSTIYAPAKRLQFVNGSGGPTGSVAFSTVILGRGAVADAGLHRLAATTNGITRQLEVAA